MFNPIDASKNIEEEYEDYLKTFFRIENEEYAHCFSEALKKPGAVAKGPYLEVSDSYKQGATAMELIKEGVLSSLFEDLENGVPESKKEFQLERPLYRHQETAIRKTNEGRNLVVTTGTGSGKTECFVIPIINSLLREKEAGTLDAGVRAILIYPMNALANDQMKRFRKLLGSYEGITFGVYNSSTQQTHESGVREYGRIFKDANGSPLKPYKNEIVSRDEMRSNPPHILVTNYAMLEYMMLRPKDDFVFSGAKLRFLVLDEAHTYRGATGIETSILLKRLKARISNPENVQNILTSATLGDKDCDDDIVRFAETLCDAHFDVSDIVRSETDPAAYGGAKTNVSAEMFAALANPGETVNDIAKRFGMEYPREMEVSEFLHGLCLGSDLYRDFRKAATYPMTVPEIVDEMRHDHPEISNRDVVNITAVASQASKGNTPLVKIRYHMFAKALEGAYVTLGKYKNVLLDRNKEVNLDERGKVIDEDDKSMKIFDTVKIFECAVCDDCGRMSIFGKEEKEDGKLRLKFAKDRYDRDAHFYFVYGEGEESVEELERDDHGEERDDANGARGEEPNVIGMEDYILCTKCGAIFHESIGSIGGCDCNSIYRVKVKKIVPDGNKKVDDVYDGCPACPSGHLRLFYPGYNSVTSVLGTALFEELPEHETVLKKEKKTESLFGTINASPMDIVRKNRQFLTFSDSRGDAAFFASYMSASYKEFLRRRGMVHVLGSNRERGMQGSWSVDDFVADLTGYFDTNRTFAEPETRADENLNSESRKNAWIAVLNEMVNASRSTSLVSLGFLKFENRINSSVDFSGIANRYGKDEKDVKALFDLLVMDMVSFGAVEGDYSLLNDDDREFIYFSAARNRVKVLKDPVIDKGKSQIMSWTASTYTNGNYRKNGRLKRVMDVLEVDEKTANDVLRDYWDNVLMTNDRMAEDANGGCYLSASNFTICATGEDVPIYRCKKCGKVAAINCENQCPVLKCRGELETVEPKDIQGDNHYVKLYRSNLMKPFHIKEHTAQLGREEQKKYQELFVDKKINSLSCSTTFELGVDVGDLETVYMRNVPPTPANYVQRAGRAGRGAGMVAYSLTYAKLSSHDFTFFKNPENMITGKIGVPYFTLENEKIVQRHVFAVALSSFFAKYPEVYNGDDADFFLNGGGWENLCEYLNSEPKDLKDILRKSIPDSMQGAMGIESFSWKDRLIGEKGILAEAVRDYNATISYYESEMNKAFDEKRDKEWNEYSKKLKGYRRSAIKGDNNGKNDLIDFFVRNNVLPKYGFPVDTVELYKDLKNVGEGVQMTRDLQLAVSEYAPSSQIVADGKIYTSRYIKKAPPRIDRDGNAADASPFDIGYIAHCENKACDTWNYSLIKPAEDRKCISCGETIEPGQWEQAIEPRMGFVAEAKTKTAGMKKPQKRHAGKFSYIGNLQMGADAVEKYDFVSNGTKIRMETSRNDSLMRVCSDVFFVCPWCGYAESDSENMGKRDYTQMSYKLDRRHENAWGRRCGNEKLYRYRLSHEFKTDVVKIIFYTPEAGRDTMLSVMYALLEAMAAELDIERDDIAGCLHPIMWNGELIYSIILYDAVAGGAGHVHRLSPQDGGKTFMEITEKAMDITGNCKCSPSCYNCLRNYGNSDVHDLLDRFKAYDFLDRYCRRIEIEPKT